MARVSATTPRYVVTELEGFLTAGETRNSRRVMGLSTRVLDTLVNHRCVGSWRSEDYGPSTERNKDYVRFLAMQRACELNGDASPQHFNRWRSHFRPTCPSCGVTCDPHAAYCSCGKNLYRQEKGH